MRHHFRAASITRFKIILASIVIFSTFGFSSPKENAFIQTNVSAKIVLPKWYHEGLYFDGKNIWVNNGRNGKTWIIDTSSGAIIKEIVSIDTFTEAVTAASPDLFFVTDWDTEKIYTARVDNGRMVAQSQMSVAPAHPAGAVWTGSKLFLITWTRGVTGTKFSLIEMDGRFNILAKKKISDIQEPAHMAWDGKSLWVTSWYNRRVYRIDPERLEVTGYFKSPVDKTTGIAFDGKYFWLTGTNADLYRIEVQNQGGAG